MQSANFLSTSASRAQSSLLNVYLSIIVLRGLNLSQYGIDTVYHYWSASRARSPDPFCHLSGLAQHLPAVDDHYLGKALWPGLGQRRYVIVCKRRWLPLLRSLHCLLWWKRQSGKLKFWNIVIFAKSTFRPYVRSYNENRSHSFKSARVVNNQRIHILLHYTWTFTLVSSGWISKNFNKASFESILILSLQYISNFLGSTYKLYNV